MGEIEIHGPEAAKLADFVKYKKGDASLIVAKRNDDEEEEA